MEQSQNMGLSDALLDILVCPNDRQSLVYVEQFNVLYNPRLKKSYEIRDSIPVMIVEEAKDVDDKTHDEYIQKATRYTGPRDLHAL